MMTGDNDDARNRDDDDSHVLLAPCHLLTRGAQPGVEPLGTDRTEIHR